MEHNTSEPTNEGDKELENEILHTKVAQMAELLTRMQWSEEDAQRPL